MTRNALPWLALLPILLSAGCRHPAATNTNGSDPLVTDTGRSRPLAAAAANTLPPALGGGQLRSGQTLALEPGDYRLDGPLTLARLAGVTICPRGTSGVVRITGAPIIARDCTGLRIQGIEFADGPTQAIDLHGGRDAQVRGCRFTRLGLGAIRAILESDLVVADCSFTQCDCLAPGGRGKIVDLWRCTRPTVRGCSFDNMRGGYQVLLWGGTCDALVSGNTFTRLCLEERDLDGPGPLGGDAGAVYIQWPEPKDRLEQPTRRVMIEDNEFQGILANAVYIDGPLGPYVKGRFAEEITVRRNRVTDCTQGVLVRGGHCTVQDNTFTRVNVPTLWVTPGGGNDVQPASTWPRR